MPGIVNRPFARVRAPYVVPDGPCTATMRTPSSGAPAESVATPAIAPVVTPWARAAPAPNTETTAAATKARRKPTIQRMDEPLRGGNGPAWRVPIETGRKWSRTETASRTLGGSFTQQIHGRDRDQNIRHPCREHRGQHTARADGFRQLKHQQHDECRRETRRDAPRRAALRRRDRERRPEERDQQTDEGNRDLERQFHLQLLGVGPTARQRVDVAPQLG